MWWNGRHQGLKIPCGQPRTGSSPVTGTENSTPTRGCCLQFWWSHSRTGPGDGSEATLGKSGPRRGFESGHPPPPRALPPARRPTLGPAPATGAQRLPHPVGADALGSPRCTMLNHSGISGGSARGLLPKYTPGVTADHSGHAWGFVFGDQSDISLYLHSWFTSAAGAHDWRRPRCDRPDS